MQKENKYPEEGELAMGIVTKVLPYGVFVRLNDYPDVEGMIHISEVSSKWVKNIRDYASEGETTVVKVLKVDASRGHVDLSLRSVKVTQKKMLIDQNKQEKKAIKLIELAGERLKEKDKAAEIVEKLTGSAQSLYDMFLGIKKNGTAVLKNTGIDDKWIAEIGKIVEDNVTIPRVGIKAEIELSAAGPDGVDVVRNALIKAKEQCNGNDVESSLKYVSAPRYALELTGSEYKPLEKCLERVTNTLMAEVGKRGKVVVTKKKQ